MEIERDTSQAQEQSKKFLRPNTKKWQQRNEHHHGTIWLLREVSPQTHHVSEQAFNAHGRKRCRKSEKRICRGGSHSKLCLRDHFWEIQWARLNEAQDKLYPQKQYFQSDLNTSSRGKLPTMNVFLLDHVTDMDGKAQHFNMAHRLEWAAKYSQTLKMWHYTLLHRVWSDRLWQRKAIGRVDRNWRGNAKTLLMKAIQPSFQ